MQDDSPTPGFARLIPAHELSAARPRALSATADEAERDALAAFLGVDAVKSFGFEGRIAPEGARSWRLTGRVTAKLTQTCVVTLAPLRIRLEEEVNRLYSLDDRAEDADLDFDPEGDDPPDPVGDGVDYGAAAVEALSLAIDPYPRAPGAAFDAKSAAPPGAEPLTEERAKPFAGLAALKKAMEQGE